MNNEAMFSSGTEHWSTPIELFDELNLEHKFTVDVCADTTNYKVKRYFNKKTDGLAQSWDGEVAWCNPPYGKEIKLWIEKAYESTKIVGCNTTVVMLLPTRTDTRWFHEFIYNNPLCSVKFIKGRLKFSGSKNSAPFPSMIVTFKSL